MEFCGETCPCLVCGRVMWGRGRVGGGKQGCIITRDGLWTLGIRARDGCGRLGGGEQRASVHGRQGL